MNNDLIKRLRDALEAEAAPVGEREAFPTVKDCMRRAGYEDYHGRLAFTVGQFDRLVALLSDRAIAAHQRAQQPQSAEAMAVWRSMEDDPPKKTGRYCVGHRGNFFGHAYYTARVGDTHYPVGWNQVPKWRPSHWLDVPYIGDATPQPSAGVVMPERKECDDGYPSDDWLIASAWNACLDEFARLNGKEVGRG